MVKGRGEHHDAGNRSGKRPHSEVEDIVNQGGRFPGSMRGGRWPGVSRGDFGRTHPNGRFGIGARGNFRAAPHGGRGRGWESRGPVGRFNGRGRY